MSVSPFRSLLNLFCIISSKQTGPCIDVQPQIFLPQCYADFKDDDVLIPVKTLMGTCGLNRGFTLEFSINYHIYSNIDISFILSHFKLTETQVILKKYKKKKTKEEKYDSLIHSPEHIKLPADGESINGVHMSITTWTASENIYNLQKGCQLISIYNEIKGERRMTKGMLRTSLVALRLLFGLRDQKESKDNGFQFNIEVERQNDTDTSNPRVSLSTFIFELIFKENGYEVMLNEVDKDLYHLGD